MRKVSIILVTAATLALAWVALTYSKGEPVTAAIQQHRQAKLADKVDKTVACRRRSPVGVLEIPSLDLKQVVVEGVEDELRAGPGHYPLTALPGEGRVIGIAGHRTTWGAPFRRLDELEKGGRITFCGQVYRVERLDIVDPSFRPWSGRGEYLVLSTCHPVYSARQRLLVYARPA